MRFGDMSIEFCNVIWVIRAMPASLPLHVTTSPPPPPPHPPTPPPPTPPHPIPPTFRQFWAKFTPWLGFQPDEKEEESEASRVSNNVESGPSASHELVAKAAALTTGKSRKVQAGDNELLINPWHLVKTKSNWNFSPPKAAALAPGESP